MRTAAALFSLAALLPACADEVPRPRTEDDARQIAPLPACLVTLDGSGGKLAPANAAAKAKPQTGVARTLREDQIWPLVYPSYDATHARLPEGAHACNGRVPDLTGGTSVPIQEGAIEMGGGGDRLKLAWLRSHTFDDGSTGGALALLRGFEGTAEVYAVGTLRTHGKTDLAVERIGKEVVATATDQGCAGRKGAPCDTVVNVYLPRYGVLQRVATIATERLRYATDSEPAVRGKAEYHLTSAIQYFDGGIRVLEQVLVRDEQNREIRKAELERAYTFAPDGTMVVDEDSLWGRVVGKATASSEKAKTPAAAAPKEDGGGADVATPTEN